MGWIKVLAGDLDGEWMTDTGFLGSGPFKMAKPRAFRRPDTAILTGNIAKLEIQTAESLKELAGTAHWGFLGMALLGPLGAIGGMLVGGRGTKILFSALLKDGRRFLATTDENTFKMLAASAFNAQSHGPSA